MSTRPLNARPIDAPTTDRRRALQARAPTKPRATRVRVAVALDDLAEGSSLRQLVAADF